MRFWADLIDTLRNHFDVIALDFPGHGLSPALPAAWSFEKACDGVAELMDRIGVDAAHIVGLSFGGMVAQQMALSHPDRVRSLTLLATAASFPSEVRSGMIEHAAAIEAGGMQAVLPILQYWIAETTARDRPEIVDQMAKSVLRMDPIAYGAIWRMIARFDVLDQLSGIDFPTHVMVGDLDRNTPQTFANAISQAIHRASVAVLPNCSHLMQLDDPHAVSAAINEWLVVSGA